MALITQPMPAQPMHDRKAGRRRGRWSPSADDPTTLDPAIGYDWHRTDRSVKSGHDLRRQPHGLQAGVRPSFGPIWPRDYTISDDGQTYTFKLRDGVEVPQRPRSDLGRRQVFARARRQPGDAEPGRRLFQR